jgi:hypothetical protein
MSRDNWKTLRVPPERYEQAKAQKEEHNRTWGEQLVTDEPEVTEVVPVDELLDQLEIEVNGGLDATERKAIAREVAEELR